MRLHNKSITITTIELDVGERFELGGKRFECVERADIRCDGCDFLNEQKNCMLTFCWWWERGDRKNVMFKELDTETKDTEAIHENCS